MDSRPILSQEDYLRKHLENLESAGSFDPQQILSKPSVDKIDTFNTTKTSDLHYFSFDTQEFPCGNFYSKGDVIQVRASQVKEIQAYSMIDDGSYYDIIEKMNDMLSSCVRIKHLDGSISSYLEIKDPDRYYLIFLIRELTFQKGTTLSTTTDCSCGKKTSIDLMRVNFQKYKIDENLQPYFDNRTNCFRFEVVNGKIFYLSPPTIGLQKAFTEYVIRENLKERKPNLSFLKIIPFTLVGKNTISQEEIKTELERFEKIDDISFQFLNSVVEKMTFGIEKITGKCECGIEIHTPMTFPDGPSGIFVIHDAFDQFIKK